MTTVLRSRPNRVSLTATLLCALLLTACKPTSAETPAAPSTPPATPTNLAPGEQGVAVFAGGCFWCTESDFDKVPGVIATTSGYIGGSLANPSYEQVSAGTSGHIEAVLVNYDPSKTNYATLLEAFWPTIDPVTPNAQFCDRGPQYRSAIFYSTPEEKALAEASRDALQASGRLKQAIVTEILPGTTFYPAEEYHQDYYQKNPLRYSYYRNGCGRDDRLEQLWGKQG
ncbi:peptide-methionine (S)-S-oxide reductase MsrA [Pseudomonas sp. UBA2684]|uniref:peptide-methionine (S)-S-oxide reductase MsrA n=1 Tax=Pseudomonas sp. UBA2684 TaxID=1947311 RepID=UPI000E9A250C|nr:peptide-methionine (S)-S-oxide reductase MsrA [Pseudomonas sp. UBA2684]HBX56115.1 peptide-methionine (S)-S-oxide reductase [Pseudomonas sp.]|tara:strand:- start:42149 stop:42829 length:681 start_codon:yes stop_codon:yes gene_type:complete